MLNKVYIFYKLLSKRRKIQLNFIFLSLLVGGLLESFTISISVPFIYVITNRNDLTQVPSLGELFNLLNIIETQEILKYVTLIFTAVIIFASVFKLFNQWLMYRISAAICSDISTTIFRNIINTPYEIHLARNTSDIISKLNLQVEQALYPSVIITLQIIFIITNVIFISFSLLLINPLLALISTSILFLTFLFISITTKKRLLLNSKFVATSEIKLVKNVQESMGFLKEIIISGNSLLFTKDYESTDREKRKKQAEAQFIYASPKYILEGVALIGISIMSVIIIFFANDSKYEFAYIGSLAISSQKLLPFINSFFSSISKMRSVTSQLDNIYELLNSNKVNNSLYDYSNLKSLPIKKEIRLENISFKYKTSRRLIINNLNLVINKGEKIGIIGKTGSGKSTLIELIIGLLKPTNGEIKVDGINIHKNKNNLIKRWRKSISYISQDLYLLDKSIRENISFISEKNLISNKKLDKVIELSELNQFINQIPEGVNTKVGERGLKLSGGQRQRIGIARSFFRNSDLIVLDEATSAIDKDTQTKILKNLEKVFKNKTIIFIAHRLNSLKMCDRIFEVKNGNLKELSIEVSLDNDELI
tara:strand:+ start:2153 stop:3931 length:1779 start_codon:yes stop_codon:yes gene_type:complete